MMTNVDTIANILGWMGRLARSMPPAWDGAKISQVASGPDGQVFGRMLPGRGLYLARDLKTLGITKPIANVYERSNVARAVEGLDRYGYTRGHVYDAEKRAIKFLDGLAVLGGCLVPACAITGYSGIIYARSNGKGDDWTIGKASITTVAQAWSSMFRAAGQPAAGTYTNIPGGSAPNRTAAGAWSLGSASPTGTDKKYLLTLGMSSVQNLNMWMFVDLLIGAGNILATTAAAQTVNTTALTRYTTGAGVMATLECTTQTSATAHNFTLNKYTDQGGATLNTTGAQTMTASATAMIVQRLFPVDTGSPFFNLASGDYGIRSVEEATCSAALGAGVYALNLVFPLAYLPGIASSTYAERDSTIQVDGLTELVLGSDSEIGCMTGYVMPNTTSTGVIAGFMRSCRG